MEYNNKANYEIDPNVNIITNEYENSYIALRRVKWFDNDYKLELRKWTSSTHGETPGKGITFNGDEDLSELVETLIENGYGDTQTVQKLINKRSGNEEENNKPTNPIIIGNGDGFYDPKDIF